MLFAALIAMLVAIPALAADPSPTSRPAIEETPLPTRKSAPPAATTQATGTAATGTPAAPASDPFDLKRLGFALGAVILIIFASQKVWRKLGLPGAPGKSTATLQVISRLNLSPRQQVLLLRVGRRVVLVGNTGTQLAPLSEITDPDEVASLLGQSAPAAAGASAAAFDEVLSGAERTFTEEPAAVPGQRGRPLAEPGVPSTDEVSAPELATTRQELGDLMERVRSLSKQFSK